MGKIMIHMSWSWFNECWIFPALRGAVELLMTLAPGLKVPLELKKRWRWPSEITTNVPCFKGGMGRWLIQIDSCCFPFLQEWCHMLQNSLERVDGEIAEGHRFLTTFSTVLKTHLTSSKSPLEVGRALTTMVLPLCSMGLTLHPSWLVDQQ